MSMLCPLFRSKSFKIAPRPLPSRGIIRIFDPLLCLRSAKVSKNGNRIKGEYFLLKKRRDTEKGTIAPSFWQVQQTGAQGFTIYV